MYVEVEVPKTATVAELKEAVKDVFNQSPIDEMISWYARIRCAWIWVYVLKLVIRFATCCTAS